VRIFGADVNGANQVEAKFLQYMYTKFKVKNAEALHTLYKHYSNLETMETTPRISESLVWF